MKTALTFEEAINPNDYTFRMDVLQKYSPRELSAWLTEYYTKIRQHLMSRIKYLIQTTPDIMKRGMRIHYLSQALRWAMLIDYDNYRFQPFSHLIALCGLASGTLSCHEVLFGESKRIPLPKSIDALLELYLSSSDDVQTQALGKLGVMAPRIDNPVYVSYYRFRDLASEAGIPVNQWFTRYYMNAELFTPMVSFKEDLMKVSDDLHSYRSVAVGTSSLWWMVLLVCINEDISADYFLCDNYTYFVQRNGRDLTEQEGLFVSAYLRACNESKMNCRHYLMYQHLKN